MPPSQALMRRSALCFLLVCSPLAAQSGLRLNLPVSDEASPQEGRRFYQNFYEGLRLSFSRPHLTLMTAGLVIEQQEKWQGWHLPPSRFDLTLSAQLARTDGRHCLGAISPRHYPRAVATYRLGGVLLLDVFAGQDYAPSTYFKLLRFHQALFYNTAFTHLAKRNLNRSRPDGSDTQSFFSGHASTVFATSTFLYLELRDFFRSAAQAGRLPLMPERNWKLVTGAALFGWASYVGYSRVHDRKHYPTDVLIGALSGSLISYLVYPHPHRFEPSAQTRLRLNTSFSLSRFNLRVDF
ncbi:MAG: phosphatase PAP2 family protein [candidate division KSB1 bacterium]